MDGPHSSRRDYSNRASGGLTAFHCRAPALKERSRCSRLPPLRRIARVPLALPPHLPASVRLQGTGGPGVLLSLFSAGHWATPCSDSRVPSHYWGGSSQRDRFWCRFSAPVLGSSETASFVTRQLVASRFFQNGLLTLQFVCATHQRVVLRQTVMLHQTAQRSRLVGPWPEKRSRFALWRAAARTTLETEAHRAATLCMCIRTSL